MANQEKNLVIIIENANTEVKKLIKEGLLNGWDKNYLKAQVEIVIAETTKQLQDQKATEELIQDTEKGIKQTFLTEYRQTLMILTKHAKNDNTGLIGLALKQMKAETPFIVEGGKGIVIDVFENETVVGQAQIKNIRQYMTEYDLGSGGRYVDYTNELKSAMNEIVEKVGEGSLSMTTTRRNPDGSTSIVHKSLRNMAEIQVRYNLIVEDMEKLGDVKFVVASSHANASERCSWWQGKIFKVDLEVSSRPMGQYKGKPTPKIIGYIDGKPYYSLQQACENGFLSYNCQHRLIKYYKGVQPTKYDLVQVKQKSDATTRQRVLENRIRQYKAKAEMSVEGFSDSYLNPYTQKYEVMDQRKHFNQMSKYWQDQYKQFSKDNNLPVYRWRTRITETERELREL